MPEPIEPTIEPTPDATELATLRRVNGELVTKSATRKAKIAELETQIAELQGRLSESSDTIKEITISGPLCSMAEAISIDADLFLTQFEKCGYSIEMHEGKLVVMHDGKLSTIPFERQALAKHLAEGESPAAKSFRAILIFSKASGAAHEFVRGGSRRTTSTTSTPKFSFGLR